MWLEVGDRVHTDGREGEIIERTADGLLLIVGPEPDGKAQCQFIVQPVEVMWIVRDNKIYSTTFR